MASARCWRSSSSKTGGVAAGGNYNLTAPFYDTTTPVNTPLLWDASKPTVTSGGVGHLVVTANLGLGTFTLAVATAPDATTTAEFTHHVRDVYLGTVAAQRRAKVTSSLDPQGESVTVMEVSGALDVVDEATVTSPNGLSVEVKNVPIVDQDGDGDVDGADVTVTVGGVAIASTTIASVNFETGIITFSSAQAANTAATVIYKYAKASAASDIYRGDVLLSSDAATSGTNNNGVWVQVGDTVTVTYLDSNGATIHLDTLTVDGTEPAAVPGVSSWTLVTLAAVFVGLLVWGMRPARVRE